MDYPPDRLFFARQGEGLRLQIKAAFFSPFVVLKPLSFFFDREVEDDRLRP